MNSLSRPYTRALAILAFAGLVFAGHNAQAGKSFARPSAASPKVAKRGHFSKNANGRAYHATVVAGRDGTLLRTTASFEVLAGDGGLTLFRINHAAGTIAMWNGPKGSVVGRVAAPPKWLPELQNRPEPSHSAEQSLAPIWQRLSRTTSTTTETDRGNVKRYFRGGKLIAARLTRTQHGYSQTTWYDVARSLATAKTRGSKGEVSSASPVDFSHVLDTLRTPPSPHGPELKLNGGETPSGAAQRLVEERASFDKQRFERMRRDWLETN